MGEVNCMVCLAHIIDGAPHVGPIYNEQGIVHATALWTWDGRSALVCTLIYVGFTETGWSGYYARWVKHE